jgi:hypothetical protein
MGYCAHTICHIFYAVSNEHDIGRTRFCTRNKVNCHENLSIHGGSYIMNVFKNEVPTKDKTRRKPLDEIKKREHSSIELSDKEVKDLENRYHEYQLKIIECDFGYAYIG